MADSIIIQRGGIPGPGDAKLQTYVTQAQGYVTQAQGFAKDAETAEGVASSAATNAQQSYSLTLATKIALDAAITAGNPLGVVIPAVGIFFDTIGLAQLATITAAVTRCTTRGFFVAGDTGDASYKRVASNPNAGAASFRSADRYLPNGTTDNTNGGWWIIECPASGIRMEQVGGAGDAVPDSTGFGTVSGTYNDQPFADAQAAITFGAGPNYLFGPGIIFGTGRYRFQNANVDIKKGISVTGNCSGVQQIVWQTQLFFPSGGHGLVTNQYNTTSAGNDNSPAPERGATGCRITGICVVSADGGKVGGSAGFWQRITTAWDRCVSIGFGDGFWCGASSADTTGATKGNCNGWRAWWCIARDTYRHGLYIFGSDANAGASDHFQALVNIGGCGILDTSGLGNTHTGPEVDAFGKNGKGRCSYATPTATFVGTVIGGTLMYVSSVTSGAIQPGQTLAGTNVTITSYGPGANGLAGYYNLSADPGVTSITGTTQNIDYLFTGASIDQATSVTPGTNPNVWYPIPGASTYPAWSAAGTYEWSMPLCVIGASTRSVVSGYYTEGGLSYGATGSYFIPGQGSVTNTTPQPLNNNLNGTLAPGNAFGSFCKINIANDPANGLIYSLTMAADGGWIYQLKALRRDIVHTVAQDPGTVHYRMTGKMTEWTYGTPYAHPGHFVVSMLGIGDGTTTNAWRFRYSTTLTTGYNKQGEWRLNPTPVAGGAVASVATTSGAIASGAWAASTSYPTRGVAYTGTDGNTYIVVVPGTSGSTGPAGGATGGPLGNGTGILDGTVVWAFVPTAFVLGSVYSPAVGSVASYDPPSIAAGAEATTTVSVPGALVGDRVTFTLGIDEGFLRVRGRVTASGVVTMHYQNLTSAAIDMGAHSISVSCTRA